MFNSTFYPTPKSIFEKMIGIDTKRLAGAKILEPSAGKGDICDYIVEMLKLGSIINGHYYSQREAVIDCIEIEPELQAILRDKGYNVIASDFLNHDNHVLYDMIIMNPPFDNGAKHLLKALDIAEGAEVICLLNSETIKNPCTKDRELLLKRLADLDATITDIGQAFRGAERSTGVEVSIIRVPKMEGVRSRFEFKPANNEQEMHYTVDDINNQQLARVDVVQSLVDRYNATAGAFSELVSGVMKVKYYSDDIFRNSQYKDPTELVKKCFSTNPQEYFNQIIDAFRTMCWEEVLSATKINSVITERVRKDIAEMQSMQTKMAFTVENIEALFCSLYENRDEIMKQCVVDAFDLMTAYYEGNRIHFEGWKTNDRWQVNRKVILPWSRSIWSSNLVEWSTISKLSDIERAMCFISGQKYDNLGRASISETMTDLGLGWAGKEYDTYFFKVRAYKKGTVHLYFKDEYLWIQFNKVATAGKNWLKSA